jgi:GNAT superfamily N-acetyltransferase
VARWWPVALVLGDQHRLLPLVSGSYRGKRLQDLLRLVSWDGRLTTMGCPTVSVKFLEPHDWPDVRSARLEALRDAPHAFGTEHHVEQDRSDDEWRLAVTEGLWSVALADERIVGLAKVAPGPRSSVRFLESAWVAPDHRRRGVFKELLRAVIDRLRPQSVRELWLWVFDGNEAARYIYSHLGFVATGHRQIHESGQVEALMKLSLDDE